MVIDLKKCTIEIWGEDSSTQKISVKIGEGNLTYDEKRNLQYIKNQGRLDTVREGDEEPVDVRIDAIWEFITAASGDTIPTIEDAIKRRGPAAAWNSTSNDPCEPYAVYIVIKNVPGCGELWEEIQLQNFRYESINHDPKAGTFSITGKCNIKEALSYRDTAAVTVSSVHINGGPGDITWTFSGNITVSDPGNVEALQMEDPDNPGWYMVATYVSNTSNSITVTYSNNPSGIGNWRITSQPDGIIQTIHLDSGVTS